MFNLVIQDTLISPLILLFDFLNPHDYLPGSAIGPSLESLLFHGEIFESLFEIEVTKYYHVFRLAINRQCSDIKIFWCCIYLEPCHCRRGTAFHIQLDVDGLPFRSLDFLAWFSRKFYCFALWLQGGRLPIPVLQERIQKH